MTSKRGGRQAPGARFPGPLSTESFLRRHWQRRPLLVRGAFPGFTDPMSPAEVLALAGSPDAESRLVRRSGARWSLEHGPLPRSRLRRLPATNWTVLVQDTTHHGAAADALLARFAFVPHARVDDLMVSYAVPGGTVGPHVDSYDVFLLQGSGRRRWQISRQEDLAFVPGLPLKILARFEPEEEWVLEAGDMLYLPPDVAHHGVAESHCLTWSIGFRAPSDAQFAAGFLDFLGERIDLAGAYRDPGLRPARHPGSIPADMLAHVERVLARIRWTGRDVREFAGRFLSEPKPHVHFSKPARALSRERFERQAVGLGLTLDRRARLLFSGRMVFMNGEVLRPDADSARGMRRLADRRRLDRGASLPAAFWDVAHQWHACGYVHLGKESGE
jgi:50S ribosomal protein L16 3-hydroxylase